MVYEQSELELGAELQDLLDELFQKRVELSLSEDGRVHCRGYKGVLKPELMERMRKHKEAITALLSSKTTEVI